MTPQEMKDGLISVVESAKTNQNIEENTIVSYNNYIFRKYIRYEPISDSYIVSLTELDTGLSKIQSFPTYDEAKSFYDSL